MQSGIKNGTRADDVGKLRALKRKGGLEFLRYFLTLGDRKRKADSEILRVSFSLFQALSQGRSKKRVLDERDLVKKRDAYLRSLGLYVWEKLCFFGRSFARVYLVIVSVSVC